MRKKILVFALSAVFWALSFASDAQQTSKIPRIGYLAVSPLSSPTRRQDALKQGLRELGYVETKNIVIEFRSGDGKFEGMPALAAELVGLKVDVFVTGGTGATRPAMEATRSIPIVMGQDDDPVGNGFVASLARPGGNITGLSNFAVELSGKRLELLKEVIPKLARVAVFDDSRVAGNAQSLKDLELAAKALGVKLQYLDVLSPKDIATSFRAAAKERADAVLMQMSGPVLNPNLTEVVDLAVMHRLPVMYRDREQVEAGGLMNYGVSINDLFRRAATYVDKILKAHRVIEWVNIDRK